MFKILSRYFDAYTLKARVIPAIIAFFPLFIVPVIWAHGFSMKIGITGLGVAIFLAVCSMLAGVMQAVGNKYQNKIKKSWNGLPSTRYLRIKDKTFDKKTKKRLYQKINETFSIKIDGKDDTAIDNAFTKIRTYLREKAPNQLYQSHNINYGLYRNLSGIRWHSLIASLAVGIGYFCVVKYNILKITTIDLSLLGIMFLLQLLVIVYAPYLCRVNAEHYAHESISLFDILTSKNQEK